MHRNLALVAKLLDRQKDYRKLAVEALGQAGPDPTQRPFNGNVVNPSILSNDSDSL